MAWQCAVCYEREDVNVVCHHCGRPLCAKKQDGIETCRLLVVDDAFAETDVRAYHCPGCARKHHPEAVQS